MPLTVLHVPTQVLPGQRIEITVPELSEGQSVSLLVLVDQNTEKPVPPCDALRDTSSIEMIRFEDQADVGDIGDRDQWHSYLHLERRPGSNYKQLFIKGRRMRAEVIYRQTVGLEPRTPVKVAEDYDLPLEAVNEAIHYSVHHARVLREDWEREEASVQEYERLHPPVLPPVECSQE